VLDRPGPRRLKNQRGEVVFVFADIAPDNTVKDSAQFSIINLFCNQLVVCQVNLTVFGNISGKIPATQKIIVVNLCDSCN